MTKDSILYDRLNVKTNSSKFPKKTFSGKPPFPPKAGKPVFPLKLAIMKEENLRSKEQLKK